MSDGHERLHGPTGPFPPADLAEPAPAAAQALLGALLIRSAPGGSVIVRITEVEAYRQDDPASHSRNGPTPGNRSMFAAAGTAYVYRSYGVHWLLNVVVEPAGDGAAVLLRAATVIRGAAQVRERRPGVDDDAALLRGPGCLGAGLDIDAPRHDGAWLLDEGVGLHLARDGWRPDPAEVRTGPRVGVSAAPDRPWRLHLGVASVSRYRRSPRAAP